MTASRSRFGIAKIALHALLAATLMTGAVAIAMARPASAAQSEYSFNLLGGSNGTYGNEGGLWSSQWMVDVIDFLYGIDPANNPRPLSVATQETCDSSGVSWAQQYDYIAARLFSGTNNGYTTGFWQAKTTSYSNCSRKGNAVFARANSNADVWLADAPFQYTQAPGDGDNRGQICVHPRLWVGGPTMEWVACSTHLSTNQSGAETQLGQAANIFINYAWTQNRGTVLGGDFNLRATNSAVLTWYYPWPFQWADEVDSTYPTPYQHPQLTFCMSASVKACSMDRKIDYVWFARFGRQAQASVLDPPYNMYGIPASDHRMLLGHVG